MTKYLFKTNKTHVLYIFSRFVIITALIHSTGLQFYLLKIINPPGNITIHNLAGA